MSTKNQVATPNPITGEGTVWAIGQIFQKFAKASPKVKAVPTDTKEAPARCYQCRGDVPETGCPTCNGIGDLPKLQCVDMTIYRGFDEVPVQVSIRNGEVIDAWCVTDVGGSPPRYGNGTDIALLPDEEQAALDVLIQECNMCKGDKVCWITEDQAEVDCPYCGGRGFTDRKSALRAKKSRQN